MPIGVAGIGRTRGVQRLQARWSDKGSGSQRASGPAATPAAQTGRTYGCNRPIDRIVRELLPRGRPHMGPLGRKGSGYFFLRLTGVFILEL
jgi:hypothetical protein